MGNAESRAPGRPHPGQPPARRTLGWEYARDSVQTGVSPGVSTEARREGGSKAVSFRRWILVWKQEFAAKFQRFPFQNLLISCFFPPSQLSLPSPSHIPLSSKNVLASPQPGFSPLTHVPCQAPEKGRRWPLSLHTCVGLPYKQVWSSQPAPAGFCRTHTAGSCVQDIGPTRGGSDGGTVGSGTKNPSSLLDVFGSTECPPLCTRPSWAGSCLREVPERDSTSTQGAHPRLCMRGVSPVTEDR